MDKAAVYFPRLLLGIKKAHRDVICEQYPMPNGKINIFIEFDNGEITSKFPHHQKKSAKFFSKKCFITKIHKKGWHRTNASPFHKIRMSLLRQIYNHIVLKHPCHIHRRNDYAVKRRSFRLAMKDASCGSDCLCNEIVD